MKTPVRPIKVVANSSGCPGNLKWAILNCKVEVERKPDGKGRQVDGEVELESPNEEETEVVKHLGEEVPVQKWQC